ncbi:MAG TPA: hypothetical protein VFM81_07645, partial [Actinomycetota bacterium]|nr:hypothetical protein [Actinomycetota bacterium]
SPGEVAKLDVGTTVSNIVAATLGNIVGGAILVGLVYWFVYLRPMRSEGAPAGRSSPAMEAPRDAAR